MVEADGHQKTFYTNETRTTADSKFAGDSFVSLTQLRPGMMVRGRLSGTTYMVTGNYGGRVTAVRIQDITNPLEWEIVRGWAG